MSPVQKCFSLYFTLVYWPKFLNGVKFRRVRWMVNIAIAMGLNIISDINVVVNWTVVHHQIMASLRIDSLFIWSQLQSWNSIHSPSHLSLSPVFFVASPGQEPKLTHGFFLLFLPLLPKRADRFRYDWLDIACCEHYLPESFLVITLCAFLSLAAREERQNNWW